jgi:hypothetical protein
MREDEDDTLFSGRGQLPEDLARLERSLSRLPVPPEPDWDAAPRGERRSPVPRRPERRWAPVLAWAAAAAV